MDGLQWGEEGSRKRVVTILVRMAAVKNLKNVAWGMGFMIEMNDSLVRI